MKKYYVVWRGKKPGIFTSWDDCQAQIRGYEGAIYKSFTSMETAENAFYGNYEDYIGKDMRPLERTDADKALLGDPVWDSISVDAACSGNPGIMEYRGVNTRTGEEIFRQGPFNESTINIGEFLALIHGLAYLKQHNSNLPIYSDSRTAIKWLKTKSVKTKLKKTAKNKLIFNLIERAEDWLRKNQYPNSVLKWETRVWGEIPADFGRK